MNGRARSGPSRTSLTTAAWIHFAHHRSPMMTWRFAPFCSLADPDTQPPWQWQVPPRKVGSLVTSRYALSLDTSRYGHVKVWTCQGKRGRCIMHRRNLKESPGGPSLLFTSHLTKGHFDMSASSESVRPGQIFIFSLVPLDMRLLTTPNIVCRSRKALSTSACRLVPHLESLSRPPSPSPSSHAAG